MPARDEDPKEIAKQLYVVLKNVMALFENGQIVRNKEHDADFEWLQKQAELPGVRLPDGIVSPSAAKAELPGMVKAIATKYRDSIQAIVAQAHLPHDLPKHAEMSELSKGLNSGPKKPSLERGFKTMGYSVSGGTGSAMGSFSVRRRTAAHSTLELRLDTGTWFHAVMAMFLVYGLGWKATLLLPPAANAVAGAQYPIGDAEQWNKVVENLAALVTELERTFVPEIEAMTGHPRSGTNRRTEP